jgi:hypothetical protein
MPQDQHTPGPWHMGEGNGEGSIFMTGEGRMRFENGTTLYPICTMVRGWKRAEDDANARLIAAAPALLEALEWLTRSPSMTGPAGTTAYIISDERMQAAKAAVAAAKGTTP